MRVLAFAGFSEAGKSEAAKYVSAKYGPVFIKPPHIKTPMMEMATPFLIRWGVPEDQVYDYLDGEHKFTPLPGRPDLTGKKVLQVIGKEFRDGVDPTGNIWMEMWCDEAERCARQYNRHILMESHRYENEGDVLRNAGHDFVTVWIERPGKEANGGEQYEQRIKTKYTVINSGPFELLYSQIELIILAEGFLNVST